MKKSFITSGPGDCSTCPFKCTQPGHLKVQNNTKFLCPWYRKLRAYAPGVEEQGIL